MPLLRLSNLKEIELQENENDMLAKAECVQSLPFFTQNMATLKQTFTSMGTI